MKRVTLATVIRKPIVSRWDHDFDYTFSAKSSKGSCTQLVLNWALGSSTTWKRNSTTSLEPYTCCQLNILIPFSFDLLSTLEMGRLTFKFTKPISRILLTGYTKSLLDPSLRWIYGKVIRNTQGKRKRGKKPWYYQSTKIL